MTLQWFYTVQVDDRCPCDVDLPTSIKKDGRQVHDKDGQYSCDILSQHPIYVFTNLSKFSTLLTSQLYRHSSCDEITWTFHKNTFNNPTTFVSYSDNLQQAQYITINFKYQNFNHKKKMECLQFLLVKTANIDELGCSLQGQSFPLD